MRYLIGELRIGDLLDVAFNVFRDNYRSMLGVAGMAFAPVLVVLLAALVSGAMPMFSPFDMMSQPFQQHADPEAFAQTMQADFKAMFMLMPVIALISNVCFLFAHGALALAAASGYLGHPVTAGQALRFSLGSWWPLIKTTLAFLLITFLYFGAMGGILAVSMMMLEPQSLFFIFLPLFLIVFVLMFFVILRYSLSFIVTILEGVSGFSALKRSAALMKGSYGKSFLLLLLVWVASMIPSMLINVLGMVPGMPFFIITMGGGTFVQMILIVFLSTVLTLLYFSNRCKHENFDLVLLAEEAAA